MRDFECGGVSDPGDHLLGNYSGKVIQSCVIEELKLLTYFRTKILRWLDSNFLEDLENLIAATQDLVTSKALDAAYRDFFEWFLIYLKILQAVSQGLSALTIQKIKPDVLEFFPDVRKLSTKCAALPDFGVLTLPIEDISFSDAAFVFRPGCVAIISRDASRGGRQQGADEAQADHMNLIRARDPQAI
jgi:hypothetical protein